MQNKPVSFEKVQAGAFSVDASPTRHNMRFSPLHAVLISSLYFLCSVARAADKVDPSIDELKQLSLEDLMNQRVTMVSRTPERLFESPSAVQILRGEDIRRSGAFTLAQALRLAPNLQVAQQNSHDWAVTARGFNGAPLANNSLADKLLVMIDGRSVYTPLFGGVFWDVQQVLLEDIDRIEVVSGPGASLWGANAVNGVINVVTKSPRETQGLYVSGAAGSFLQDWGAVRYGGQSGSNFFYRVYGQRFDQNSTFLATGESARDRWDMTQGGIRMEYIPQEGNTVTLQSDGYSGREGSPTDAVLDGQNVLGRWQRIFSDESDLSLQLYFDRTWRRLSQANFADELRTYDLDFQHRFPIGERQRIVWGLGYRLYDDSTRNTATLGFFPADRHLQLFSGFAQDEITLVEDKLRLTLGSKLEHNDYSGFEPQPSARLAWMVNSRNTLWAAVSRASRSPARFDVDVRTPAIYTPNGEFDSESVLAYELGYRFRPVDVLTLSFAGFYNDYSDIRSINLSADPPPALIFSNGRSAESYGVEFNLTYRVLPGWRLRGGYTWLLTHLRATEASVFPGSAGFEASDPKHQVILQSLIDLPANLRFDTVFRYVDTLPGAVIPALPVPAYVTFDARLSWTHKNFEVAIVGQNLAQPRHNEFGTREIPRSIYGEVSLRF